MTTPRVKLGCQGLEVSKLGFGCMGLTGAYNLPVSEKDGISIIKHAFNNGITLMRYYLARKAIHGVFYGKDSALKQLPREKVQVATKYGLSWNAAGTVEICGKPDYVRACCESSLRRLGIEYIDLYYQHRIDTTTPIEETMGELKKLVEEGKVKYIGLSEPSPDTIRRAHAVHPISALQMEWSLWTRDIESDIVPLCRELGIGIVPYSPLGRGFFCGRGVVEENKYMANYPRFDGKNLEKNKPLFTRLENLAKKHKCTTGQLALAWVLHQGDDVVPIPGTTKIKNLDDNIGSLNVKLSEEDIKMINITVRADEVAGSRAYRGYENTTWRYANTPPLTL